mmetsp:Transcript_17219/g.55140  ORF Transcript_17219/g.55140 Transcript_17219/m.55140 type:complete len:253 (-) Transcript_17219:121-879(-)
MRLGERPSGIMTRRHSRPAPVRCVGNLAHAGGWRRRRQLPVYELRVHPCKLCQPPCEHEHVVHPLLEKEIPSVDGRGVGPVVDDDDALGLLVGVLEDLRREWVDRTGEQGRGVAHRPVDVVLLILLPLSEVEEEEVDLLLRTVAERTAPSARTVGRAAVWGPTHLCKEADERRALEPAEVLRLAEPCIGLVLKPLALELDGVKATVDGALHVRILRRRVDFFGQQKRVPDGLLDRHDGKQLQGPSKSSSRSA